MAKRRAAGFDISGTIGGLTFVRSKYGKTIRAARGTHKPAKCNDSLTAVTIRNAVVNHAAKIVHDVLRVYAAGFKDTDLWQQMISRIRSAATDEIIDLLQKLEGLEAHSRCRLEHILIDPKVTLQFGKGITTVQLVCRWPPDFRLLPAPGSYRCEICILFITAKRNVCGTEILTTPWTPIEKRLPKFEVSFNSPRGAKYFVLILKTEAGNNRVPHIKKAGKGIRVVKVGMLESGSQKSKLKNTES